MYKKSKNKNLSNIVEKLLKYRIIFKDVLTFLGLDYRDASLLTLFFVIQYSKNQINRIIITHKNFILKKLKIKKKVV